MNYLPRAIDLELDELMAASAAISLDGAKGVGKTDTAHRRSAATWFLDDPDQRQIAAADFTLSTAPTGTLLIDEWQQLPQIWDSVRRAVDAGAPAGRFLLTGSATPGSSAGTHSGAGRILTVRMRPMALFERGSCAPVVSLARVLRGQIGSPSGVSSMTVADYAQAITGSGFPGIMSVTEPTRTKLLDGYLQRIIDRDLPEAGFGVRRPELLRRWLSAFAAATATTTSYSKLLDATTGGDGTQPAKTTTMAYREHLTRLWLLDSMPGWLPANNSLKRLQQAPKHHLADPALAARLLRLSPTSLLSAQGAHMMGPLFESLATLTVRVAAQAAHAHVSHLRLTGGDREIDLVVEGAEGQILPIEVKLAGAVSDSDVRHLHWLRAQLPTQIVDLMVITAGTQAYRRPDGVLVVPLDLLGV